MYPKVAPLSFSLAPLSPPRWPLASPETPVGICVNSPGRRALQKRSLDSISDLQFLGKVGAGRVILRPD